MYAALSPPCGSLWQLHSLQALANLSTTLCVGQSCEITTGLLEFEWHKKCNADVFSRASATTVTALA